MLLCCGRVELLERPADVFGTMEAELLHLGKKDV